MNSSCAARFSLSVGLASVLLGSFHPAMADTSVHVGIHRHLHQGELPGGEKVRIPFDARRIGVTDLVAFYAASRSAPPIRTFRTTVWVH